MPDDACVRTFKAGEAILPYRIVYISADYTVSHATGYTVATVPIGVSLEAQATVGGDVSVQMIGPVHKVQLNDTVVAGQPIASVGAGAGDDTTIPAAGAPSAAFWMLGVALQGTSTAENSIIEVMLTGGCANNSAT